MSLWRRWLRYTKTQLDLMMRRSERDLDRREAELDPSLASDAPTPTYDEAKEKIERRTGKTTPSTPDSGDVAFDLAVQDREAKERLAKMRDELDKKG